jgi:glycosyltransferase involved in cell wall biosynthesis
MMLDQAVAMPPAGVGGWVDDRPRVSIGLPVYNGERFLAEAVESLLAQDHTDFELLLADNGSTDGTPEICERFCRLDPRVRYLPSAVNRGAAWNFNRVVDAARGEYFKWAADDDLYDPAFISGCVEVLDSRPDVVVCFTEAVEIDDTGEVFHKRGPINVADLPEAADRFRAMLLDEVYCYAVFGVIRTAVLRSTALIGPYTTSDRVLLAELALHGRFVERAEPHFLHREHAGRSMYAYADDRDRMGWFDTSRDGSRSMPRWRVGVGYARALRRAGRWLPRSTRARGAATLAGWAWVNRSALARELVRSGLVSVRDVLGRR